MYNGGMTAHKLLLIDGHALAYRMFYALPLEAFTTKQGEPTNATYGFTRTLVELILSPEPPQYLAVSFDVGATFRDALFADYKGTRAKMPEELSQQIERIKQVVQALNIPVLELEGYEADDVLGTITRQASRLGVPVHIITGDRDLLQLVDANTQVELPARTGKLPELYDETAVIDRFGVRPDQIVDWKALVGDTSDNIPGVKGIGEKTAVKLLLEYGSLDGIYAHLDEIKGAVHHKLVDGRDSAYLSYKLARIITDAPITLDLDACIAQNFDPQLVQDIFQELEFRTLSNLLAAHTGLTTSPSGQRPTGQPATDARPIRTLAQLTDLVAQLNAASLISFDVETTSLDKISADIVGICLAISPPISYYIPVGHLAGSAQATSGQLALFASEPRLADDQLPLATVLAALRGPLTNPNIPKVAHNAKFDYTILARHGLTVTPITFDTMIAEWLTDPASKHKGLKDLARHRLGVQMTDIETLIGKGKGQKSFAEIPIDEAVLYGAADADMTLRLVEPLRNEIRDKGLEQILDIEMPLISILSVMEQAGVGIDETFFRHMSQDLAIRMTALETQIHQIAGEPFNINSTQQLSDILFKKLRLPVEGLSKTSSGAYSTAANVLEELKPVDSSGLIQAILEYRELGKLKSTYVDAMPEMVNRETGRIHTSFNQTGAVTGRLASSAPNLQNIPIRSEVGQQIRRGFVARPGWLFVAADYSQVELRVLAHVSQDAALLEAFRQDQDIHRTTAAAVFSIAAEEVSYNQRRFAKAVNFGLIYGMGPYRLARDSDLTLAEAENYIKEYFARFPGIQRYLEETKKLARTNRGTPERPQYYVETLLGRRRYFPIFGTPMTGQNRQMWLRAEREAINHPIQGTAADVIKIAMIRLTQALAGGGYRAQMVLQVHDELLLEMPEGEVAEIRPLMANIMSGAFTLDVPLKVETSVGANWLELKG